MINLSEKNARRSCFEPPDAASKDTNIPEIKAGVEII